MLETIVEVEMIFTIILAATTQLRVVSIPIQLMKETFTIILAAPISILVLRAASMPILIIIT